MMPLPEKLDDKIKECLDRAIEELENGQGIPHEIIIEETKKRFSKYFE